LDPVFTYRGTFADTEGSFSVQTQAIQNMRSMEVRMDARNKRLFNIIIFGSLILTLGVTILTNLHNWWKLIPLSLLLLFSFMLRRKRLFGERLSKILSELSFAFDIVLLYLISISDMSRVAMFYFYIDIIDIVLFYPIRQSIVISVIIYFEYVFIQFVRYIKWNYFDFAYFSPVLYEDALYFVFVFLIMYIAKQQIIQTNRPPLISLKNYCL